MSLPHKSSAFLLQVIFVVYTFLISISVLPFPMNAGIPHKPSAASYGCQTDYETQHLALLRDSKIIQFHVCQTCNCMTQVLTDRRSTSILAPFLKNRCFLSRQALFDFPLRV
jgi:hypothetical protein